jgi:acetate kinase
VTSFVLVINSGSSSMKYQLVDPAAGSAAASGLIERIGGEGVATHKSGIGESGGETLTFTGAIADHGAALTIMRQLFADSGLPLSGVALVAVGHRVVHGGALFGDPVVVDNDVLQQIRELSLLAPLHNPANATGIDRAMVAFPGIPQVAVFDTAFFRDLPAAAATYAIDRTVAAEQQIRRYGFHGTSHQYVSHLLPSVLGRDVSELKTIVLHLGNGAAATAVRLGAAVET